MRVHIHVHTHKQIHQDMSNNDHSGILGSILELSKPIRHQQENDTEINGTNVLSMSADKAQGLSDQCACHASLKT